MSLPLGIFGIDIGELVEDAVRALVDLIVPDFGAQWVSSLVTWLVALPPVTGDAFPSLNRYADQLASVGFGLLGACFLAGLLQLWSGAAAGAEAVRRAAIGAGALALYTTVLESLLVGVKILTAEMIRHPPVVDGLDKALGESLASAAVTGGVRRRQWLARAAPPPGGPGRARSPGRGIFAAAALLGGDKLSPARRSASRRLAART